MSIVDVTFVGAGPAALYGAFCAGIRQASTRLVDSQEALGGQLTALYPEKYIYDVAGLPAILAKDLVANLVTQLQPFEPEIHLNETVLGLEAGEDGVLTLVTDRGRLSTRSVVLTVGIGSFSPRKIELEGLEPLEGRQVHYSVRDKSVFQGARVLVIGGGDSALDWVHNLQDTARSLALAHRTDKFRAHDSTVREIQQMAAEGRLDLRTFCTVEAVERDETGLVAVVLKNTKTGESSRVEVDHLLSMMGYKANLGPLKDWVLRQEDQEYRLDFDGDQVRVDTGMRTTIPKVYAAGDSTSYPGKLKLITLGFGEAALAVASAVGDLRGKKAGALHSSNLGPPSQLKKKVGVEA